MRELIAVLTAIALSVLLTASALTISVLSATSAGAWGHRGHHSYKSHSRRGETCWRTNRSTGQHFRSC
jgi:hypothetical protein